MKVLVIYDDTIIKSELINDIIGDKGFSDVIVKRKRIEEHYKEAVLSNCMIDAEWITVKSVFEFNNLLLSLDSSRYENYYFLHCFSNYFFVDKDSARLSLCKIKYIRTTYKVLYDKEIAMVMFNSTESYKDYLADVIRDGNSQKIAKDIKKEFNIYGIINIGYLENFIKIISGNFDSRFFNSIKGDKYTLTKTSKNKKKIKSEYAYYQLLPEHMKRWMVMPFSYVETEFEASYTMERLHMTDLAIKWVHGSIDLEEFESVLDQFFYFINSRDTKSISAEDYKKESEKLYTEKVLQRKLDFSNQKEYNKINKLLLASTGIEFNDIIQRYFRLKKIIEAEFDFPKISVIGHGDPCFSNTMYNKSTRMLKFIDPKGALTENELWMNPYYDLAKISHSICGKYDFFNNALFEIKIDEYFHSRLVIDFDNTQYKNIFKNMLRKNGFDYFSVRIYEVSLFLSMLPLHIDYPHKVFGFILNAIEIMDEIENEIEI